ncbi:MAG: apolipoprotein N-acyltransferase [Bacteroidales bacterium]|nr:apolipoprotein N-acyltransferase [Bacteroidales bacterium]
MKGKKILLWSLVVLFAVLMSVPFLVPHCGFFALFGIVPLLCMERVASFSGTRRVWIYHYSAFVLWNAFTTFWVCNATVGGGIFAVLANSLQMSLIFGLFRLSKRKFAGVLPYIFLAVAWIAWERAYFDADISWPWLVLGNAFARSIASVQWYEFTGTLGGSLWIWICNLAVFGLMVALSDGRWIAWNVKAKAAAISGTVMIFLVPLVGSRLMFEKYEEKENPLEVIVFQPNIDPYNKFRAKTQQEQDAILLGQMEKALQEYAVPVSPLHDTLSGTEKPGGPLLLLAPETFTGDVVDGEWERSMTWRRLTSFLAGYPGVNMIFGASSYSFYGPGERPSYTARKLSDRRWVESHNSALMVDGTGRTEIFHKSKLVVAVEKTPYPAVFCRIDDMLGGVMGRCVGQDSISVFHCVPSAASSPCGGDSGAACREEDACMDVSGSAAIGCAICYESIYGEYYTGYIKEGAEAMTVITNDSWWGNTPGYRQHLSYSSLRAIETRRSIARCANTGISAFIDQRGVIHSPTPWWEPAVLHGYINRNDSITFFVSHGDIAGRVCTFVFVLLAAALLVAFLRR